MKSLQRKLRTREFERLVTEQHGAPAVKRGVTAIRLDLLTRKGIETLVGYSMNDTIVIFDRIRENVRVRRRDSLVQIVNDSINQTLSRTVIASGLTFISVLAIVVFGGPVLRGFGLMLTIGIVLGTYDSIAIASPTMLWWKYITKRDSGRAPSMLKKAA